MTTQKRVLRIPHRIHYIRGSVIRLPWQHDASKVDPVLATPCYWRCQMRYSGSGTWRRSLPRWWRDTGTWLDSPDFEPQCQCQLHGVVSHASGRVDFFCKPASHRQHHQWQPGLRGLPHAKHLASERCTVGKDQAHLGLRRRQRLLSCLYGDRSYGLYNAHIVASRQPNMHHGAGLDFRYLCVPTDGSLVSRLTRVLGSGSAPQPTTNVLMSVQTSAGAVPASVSAGQASGTGVPTMASERSGPPTTSPGDPAAATAAATMPQGTPPQSSADGSATTTAPPEVSAPTDAPVMTSSVGAPENNPASSPVGTGMASSSAVPCPCQNG